LGVGVKVEMRWGTYAGSALFLVRNSQSSRVKMSFVTAAMEKRVRKALQRASMRAVLPEPTGLGVQSIHLQVKAS
jgi:hypothetical protein